MKTCDFCGCYIPDLWDSCPACGRERLPTPPHSGTNAQIPRPKPLGTVSVGGHRRIEVRYVTGQEEVMYFLDPQPSRSKTVLRRQDGTEEDLDILRDSPDTEILTRAIAYKRLGGNAAVEKTSQESSCFSSASSVWSSDPNAKPYPIELEAYWPWSEIKLHQGGRR